VRARLCGDERGSPHTVDFETRWGRFESGVDGVVSVEEPKWGRRAQEVGWLAVRDEAGE